MHSSAGSYDLWINGVSEISESSLDTERDVGSSINTVNLGIHYISGAQAVDYIVYADCVVVDTSYIGGDTLPFYDGFEVGDGFGSWTNTGEVGSSTITIDTSTVHHGVNSSKITVVNSDYVWAYKNLSPDVYPEMYYQVAVYIDNSSLTSWDVGDEVHLMGFRTPSDTGAGAISMRYHSASCKYGVRIWMIGSDDNTTYNIPLDQWVNIQLYKHYSTSGNVKVWVDGNLVHDEDGDIIWDFMEQRMFARIC